MEDNGVLWNVEFNADKALRIAVKFLLKEGGCMSFQTLVETLKSELSAKSNEHLTSKITRLIKNEHYNRVVLHNFIYDENFEVTDKCNVQVFTPLRICDTGNCICPALHVCPFYAIGACSKEGCLRHDFRSEENLARLKSEKGDWSFLSEAELQTLFRVNRCVTTVPPVCFRSNCTCASVHICKDKMMGIEHEVDTCKMVHCAKDLEEGTIKPYRLDSNDERGGLVELLASIKLQEDLRNSELFTKQQQCEDKVLTVETGRNPISGMPEELKDLFCPFTWGLQESDFNKVNIKKLTENLKEDVKNNAMVSCPHLVLLSYCYCVKVEASQWKVNLREALKYAELARNVARNDGELYVSLAQLAHIYDKKKNGEKAQEYLDLIKTLDFLRGESLSQIYMCAGIAFQRFHHRLDAALHYHQMQTQSDPNDYSGWLGYGVVKARIRRKESSFSATALLFDRTAFVKTVLLTSFQFSYGVSMLVNILTEYSSDEMNFETTLSLLFYLNCSLINNEETSAVSLKNIGQSFKKLCGKAKNTPQEWVTEKFQSVPLHFFKLASEIDKKSAHIQLLIAYEYWKKPNPSLAELNTALHYMERAVEFSHSDYIDAEMAVVELQVEIDSKESDTPKDLNQLLDDYNDLLETFGDTAPLKRARIHEKMGTVCEGLGTTTDQLKAVDHYLSALCHDRSQRQCWSARRNAIRLLDRILTNPEFVFTNNPPTDFLNAQELHSYCLLKRADVLLVSLDESENHSVGSLQAAKDCLERLMSNVMKKCCMTEEFPFHLKPSLNEIYIFSVQITKLFEEIGLKLAYIYLHLGDYDKAHAQVFSLSPGAKVSNPFEMERDKIFAECLYHQALCSNWPKNISNLTSCALELARSDVGTTGFACKPVLIADVLERLKEVLSVLETSQCKDKQSLESLENITTILMCQDRTVDDISGHSVWKEVYDITDKLDDITDGVDDRTVNADDISDAGSVSENSSAVSFSALQIAAVRKAQVQIISAWLKFNSRDLLSWYKLENDQAKHDLAKAVNDLFDSVRKYLDKVFLRVCKENAPEKDGMKVLVEMAFFPFLTAKPKQVKPKNTSTETDAKSNSVKGSKKKGSKPPHEPETEESKKQEEENKLLAAEEEFKKVTGDQLSKEQFLEKRTICEAIKNVILDGSIEESVKSLEGIVDRNTKHLFRSLQERVPRVSKFIAESTPCRSWTFNYLDKYRLIHNSDKHKDVHVDFTKRSYYELSYKMSMFCESFHQNLILCKCSFF